MDRASGTIDLANGRYGEVRMASPVPFTQKRTVVIRAKVMESKRIYRDIEISSDSTLEDLALATVEAFGWDCDHCYGFYSHLGQSLHDSKEAYELKHPLIFYFGLLGECFDRRDSRAFTAFVPEKLLVFQSSNNINSYNQITRGVLSY